MDLALALGVGRGVAALIEMVVELVDAAGAGLADLAGVGAEFLFILRHLLLGGKPVLQGFVVLEGLAAADAALDLLRRLALHGAGDVAVDVDGGGGGDVIDDGGEGFHVHAVLQRHGGEGVAQIMEADVRQACLCENAFQLLVSSVWRSRPLRLQQIREDPLAPGRLFPFPEHVERAGGQNDFALSLLGFCFSDLPVAAFHVVNGAADQQSAVALVEVAPFQAADLTPAQAGGDLRVEEIVPQRLVFDRLHESFQLLFVENFHVLAAVFGDHRAVRRVAHDHAGAHRGLQDLVEQHMDIPHGGGGQRFLLAVLAVICLFAQGVIELLHVPLGDGAQHLFAEGRDDMVPGVATIGVFTISAKACRAIYQLIAYRLLILSNE